MCAARLSALDGYLHDGDTLASTSSNIVRWICNVPLSSPITHQFSQAALARATLSEYFDNGGTLLHPKLSRSSFKYNAILDYGDCAHIF